MENGEWSVKRSGCSDALSFRRRGFDAIGAFRRTLGDRARTLNAGGRTFFAALVTAFSFLTLVTPAHADVALDDGWYGVTGPCNPCGSYPVPAGTNRLLVFVTGYENSSDPGITSIQYGAANMTRATGDFVTSSGSFARSEIWFLLDSDIPGGTNSFVVSNGTPTGEAHAYAVFTGVDQTSPIEGFASGTVFNNLTVTTASFSVLDGGMSVANAASSDIDNYISWGGGSWIEGRDLADVSFEMGTAYTSTPYAADGTDTASGTLETTAASRQVIVAASLAPAPTVLYRSVGVDALDLIDGLSLSVEINDTTATFSGSVPDNVGVGDVIEYWGAITPPWYVAFIHGRISATEFTVGSATGGVPQPIPVGSGVKVFRAYTSLFDWERQEENGNLPGLVVNFDTSTDLVADNTVMMVACYGDGPDTTKVNINDWVTGPDNYIKIYTPVTLDEVGTSQRHYGMWRAGAYYLALTAAGPSEDLLVIDGVNFVSIEGIQLEGSDNGLDDVTGLGIWNQTSSIDQIDG